ncbi:MAG: bifunctional DNA primase/polymerase [Candidatus Rokuibacteriota bacterium]
MTDAELTVAAVRAKGWECVRLAPRSKKPDGPRWQITKDADLVAEWFARGANVGLVCHQRTGVAVLDPDDLLPWADMIDHFGQPAPPWVITGSGKLHYYIAWESDLPPKIHWPDHEVVGEIQRGPGMQQVVLPGSVHPSGGTYRWIREETAGLCVPINPVTDPLPRLPGLWIAYLTAWTYDPS